MWATHLHTHAYTQTPLNKSLLMFKSPSDRQMQDALLSVCGYLLSASCLFVCGHACEEYFHVSFSASKPLSLYSISLSVVDIGVR